MRFLVPGHLSCPFLEEHLRHRGTDQGIAQQGRLFLSQVRISLLRSYRTLGFFLQSTSVTLQLALLYGNRKKILMGLFEVCLVESFFRFFLFLGRAG